jgi:hypothetical protein
MDFTKVESTPNVAVGCANGRCKATRQSIRQTFRISFQNPLNFFQIPRIQHTDH